MSDIAGKIGNWSDLAEFVRTHGNGEWLFRGVTDAENYRLIPAVGRESLLRDMDSSPSSRPYSLEEEKHYFRIFMQQARPYVQPTPAHQLEWLAVAQHHGFPTRLLDWTWSPLVAAFFATEASGIKAGKYVNPAIYAVCGLSQIPPEKLGSDRTSPFNFQGVWVYDPPHISPRIPAQRGAFTLHGDPQVELEPNVLQVGRLEKWLIPYQSCFLIKNMLDVCAINRASLFPDLDGLAQQLEWRYKWKIGFVPSSD